MDKLAFNVPINGTSLGQVSLGILREIYSRGLDIFLYPIGGIDLSTQKEDKKFFDWIQRSIREALDSYSRDIPIFKLWHLQGSLESYSRKQVLLSFYEADSPTMAEVNIVKNNNKVLLSSTYAISTFKDFGVENLDFIPLAFDSTHFAASTKRPISSIQFGLFGKLEPQRKRHLKTLSLWAKKFGNDSRYSLNCAIYNNFLEPNVQSQIIGQALEGKRYWNINFLSYIATNEAYNDLLNNTDIVLAMSGGEGWGLPEFQTVALGKHCVGLNAHAYKDWMTDENAVLINPSGKVPVYDNMFFREGAPFNQGRIFDWSEEDFYSGVEKAVSRYQSNPVNEAGLELQKRFTYPQMVDSIITILNNENNS